MADITKCTGHNCPVKEKCYRFTSIASEHWQSWFAKSPLESVDGKLTCEHFWGENSELIFEQLIELLKTK